jgi:NAD(P)-dependent dehydrogenase (short-subunit alcohol dehydrogenase family)
LTNDIGKEFVKGDAEMTTKHKWTTEDIPDLAGKVALVTGGNSGLGFETVKVLTRNHAHVVLACRDTARGHAAQDQIRQLTQDASIEVMQLDLASLASVRQFAEEFISKHNQLHILLNNAGVMAPPHRTTADGFELQLGTNHLGHFALTGLLLEVLLQTPHSRVITVSSVAERMGRINFDDLMSENSYERWTAYGQSKLANLLFAYELQRKLDAENASTISLAVHPGVTATNLRTKLMTRETPFLHRIQSYFWEIISQSVEMGVLPQLYAATAPNVQGGEFYAPGGFLQRAGYPKKVRSSRRSYDESLARQLWAVSKELTGVDYKVLAQ